MEEFMPKTELGKRVLRKEITDINTILDSGQTILEASIVDILLPGMQDELLMVGQSKGKFGGGRRRVFRQTQKKTREGNKPSFATYAVVGNGDGIVGLGYGKARETVPARDKALRKAKINVFKIARGSGSWESTIKEPHTIPFAVEGSCGSVIVQLFPAPKGKGLVAETEIQKILTLAGVEDVWSRTFGQTLISGDKRTAQGWMLIEPSEIVSTYQLPLFCSEIEVSIFNTKGFNNQVKRLSAESESQLIEFVGNSGNNLLRFLFTYDNYELTDYRVELDYQSSKVGGARYTITCVDPPNPHEDRDFCESSLEGSFGGNRSSGTGYGCCYTETVEEIYPGADDGSSLEIPRQCIDELFSRANTIIRDDQREQGVADEIILNCYESESNGGFCWSNAPREECGPEGRGERLSEDPSAYCCHPQSDGDWHGFSNTTGMPHLWNGTASNSTQDLFCMQTTRINQETNEPEKIGSLQYTSKKNLFAFDKNETSDLPGVWRECTEEQNNVAYGKWLCHNTTEELEWHRSSCSSELPNSCGPKEGIPYWLRAYRSQGDVDESFWTYDITTPNACTENKRINNQCCYEGRFFIEEHEHTHEQQTFTVKTACVSGTIITGHTEGLGPINNWFSRLGMASLQLLGGVSS